VLPDASTGHGPGTLGYEVGLTLRVSWYRTFEALVIYPGAVKFIAGSGGVRVCQVIRFYPGSWNEKQKM
jgi:hypothetical protein